MKRKSYVEEMAQTLRSIGRHSLKPDWDAENVRGREKVKRGPSEWLETRKDKSNFGSDFDYRVLDKDVFMPCCKAAQEWVYYSFPEGLNYYCDLDGFVGVHVEGGLDYVLLAAANAGLISEEEYVANMENEQLMNQGEQK